MAEEVTEVIYFWQEVDLSFFQEWRRPEVYKSGSDERRADNSAVPVLVLAAEMWDHCSDRISAAWYSSYTQNRKERSFEELW